MNNNEKVFLMLGVIAERPSPFVFSTTKYVWGKEVRRLKKLEEEEYRQEVAELQNWYVRLSLDSSESLESAGVRARTAIMELESEKAKGFNRPECHQLCEWRALEDNFGRCVSPSGEVVFVKYAVVMEADNA